MSRVLRTSLLLLILPLGGCRNACQQLCVDISDYALESCNLQFSDEDMDTCIADFARSEVDRSDLESCEEAAPYLEEEWSCEDLREYFKASGAE